jgi:hypothetical protein
VVTIRESGNTVWTKGQFVAGVAGVIAGVASAADLLSVQFVLGSGSYDFVVFGTATGGSAGPRLRDG